ncbi:MAG: hypothetical protein JHC95_01245 [Solirubrobacteraceae bacterium]|nr:hypothetical protein [Solirubrobacteraceae bacterium]
MSPRRIVLATLLALGLFAAPAHASLPDPIPLNDGWEYVEGRDQPETGWAPVSIPHTMQGETTQRTYEGTVGWYRLTFTGPSTVDGYRWAARFEGARRIATVWLNGEQLIEHRDPYTPFEVELANLRPGKTNTLFVRTDNIRPPGTREGWWNFGGLVRKVSLQPRGSASLDDTAVLPRRVCGSVGCQWTAMVDTDIVAGPDGAQPTTVDIDLASPGGVITAGSAPVRALAPNERTHLRYEVAVAGPIFLWWPASPALYRADVRLRTGDRIEDADRSRIGLRTVSVKDGQLQLNGKPLNMRGASIQEDIPGRGAAMTDADVDRTVAEVEALGADVTRAHYLLDERLLNRFDEKGILVWSQAPVYHRDSDLDDQGRRFFELQNVRDTILEARRHPSVIVHSVANELSPEPDRRPGTRRFLEAAERISRELDPTRPVALDLLAYPGYGKQHTHARFDVLGINHYYGWYEGKQDHSTRNFAGFERHLAAMHRRYPKQALVITEFGAEGVRTGPVTAKGSFAFQTNYLRKTLRVVDRTPFLSGAIYWTVREFAVKPRWQGGDIYAGDSIHSKGLLFYDGRPKPIWWAAKQEFAVVPTFR